MKISQLIYKEDKWVKNCMALTKNGRKLYDLNIIHSPNGPVYDPSKDCVAFSLYGAISHLYSGDGQQDVCLKLGDVIRRYYGGKIFLAEFNNRPETSFQDIKNVLAIAKL